jgi:MFS family permease
MVSLAIFYNDSVTDRKSQRIWLCFFMLAFQQSIQTTASVAAYADFAAAPAITTASILANIIGGVLKLPIAKTLNLWGRAEGYVVSFAVYLLGIIILAASNGPDSYAAGYVLYWIGYDQLYLIMDIFVADVSGLRNRAFAFAFVSTPFICTAFTGPLAAQAFLNNSTWRWALGAFAIIQPFVFLPLAIVFKWHQRKAEKMGIFKHQRSSRSVLQSIVHYVHEFDGEIYRADLFIPILISSQSSELSSSSQPSSSFSSPSVSRPTAAPLTIAAPSSPWSPLASCSSSYSPPGRNGLLARTSSAGNSSASAQSSALAFCQLRSTSAFTHGI